ncbi:hypothetical protein LTS10_001529 [Elasticomyces elasticus]|nr:hypothetical protein LTS10_001529 [Elasticomyces elasticus]
MVGTNLLSNEITHDHNSDKLEQNQQAHQGRQQRQVPPPTSDKLFSSSLVAMAKAWYYLVKMENKKADLVKCCGIEVFGLTAFELAMEDVELVDEHKGRMAVHEEDE